MAEKEKPDEELSKPQIERFVQAARKLGADESEPHFDAALKRVGKAKLTHPARAKKLTKKPTKPRKL